MARIASPNSLARRAKIASSDSLRPKKGSGGSKRPLKRGARLRRSAGLGKGAAARVSRRRRRRVDAAAGKRYPQVKRKRVKKSKQKSMYMTRDGRAVQATNAQIAAWSRSR
jgi:hypothetical protein